MNQWWIHNFHSRWFYLGQRTPRCRTISSLSHVKVADLSPIHFRKCSEAIRHRWYNPLDLNFGVSPAFWRLWFSGPNHDNPGDPGIFHLKVARSNAYFPETHIHLLWKLFQEMTGDSLFKPHWVVPSFNQPVTDELTTHQTLGLSEIHGGNVEVPTEPCRLQVGAPCTVQNMWNNYYKQLMSKIFQIANILVFNMYIHVSYLYLTHHVPEPAVFGTLAGTIVATCHQDRTWRWSRPLNASCIWL